MEHHFKKVASLFLLLGGLLVLDTAFGLLPQQNVASAAAPEQADTLSGGAKLFKQRCQNCHSTGTAGGCLGPVLAGESGRRTRAFIESRISNEPRQIELFQHAYGHAELMPHPRVPPAEAKELAAFIISLPAPGSGLKVEGHKQLQCVTSLPRQEAEDEGAVARGKKLLYGNGCLACHSIGGMGGTLAPSFDGIGNRRTSSEMAAKLGRAQLMVGPDPEYQERGITMLTPDLTESQIKEIVAYLSTLK